MRDPSGEGTDSTSPVIPALHAPRKVTEVNEHMEQHVVWSFACMDNKEWCWLADSFVLPKVPLMKTLELDKIIKAQCWKITRSNDQALARIQVLNSDTLSPHSELLEMLSKDGIQISNEQARLGVESAITLLGNAFAHMSMLRRQRVLEEYNKELLTFA